MFARRSYKLERIDTGDYTPAEYERFLREIRFINRRLGDSAALRASLLKDIEEKRLAEFSVLDVGAGSGELLREIAEFAAGSGRMTRLVGIDLHELSAASIKNESGDHPNIFAVRGNALALPFADDSFDYAICSLFTHHLVDDVLVSALREMSRVARHGIFVIDLHRHPMAYVLFKLFCMAYRISSLVRQDGCLSILRSFKPKELEELGEKAGLRDVRVKSVQPYRLVMSGTK